MAVSSKERAILIAQIADFVKGQDVRIYDVHEISTITAYFVIVTGTSFNHLKAIGNYMTKVVRQEMKVKPVRVDSLMSISWHVYDYGDVIVHLMVRDSREFYDIERLWRDAPIVSWKPKDFSFK